MHFNLFGRDAGQLLQDQKNTSEQHIKEVRDEGGNVCAAMNITASRS